MCTQRRLWRLTPGKNVRSGQPYVVAAATAVTGFTKESLAALPLTLPAGAKAEKWALKVLTVEGRRCLCIAPKLSGTRIVIR